MTRKDTDVTKALNISTCLLLWLSSVDFNFERPLFMKNKSLKDF